MTSRAQHIIEVTEDSKINYYFKTKYKCSKCGKKFEWLSLVMAHIQTCTGKNGIANNDCQSTYEESSENLEERVMCHCQKCGKDVIYCNKTLRGDGSGRKRCPDCKTIMSFKCLGCKKQYSSKHGLTVHLAYRHSDRKKFKCPECNYRSSVLEYLCSHYSNCHIYETQDCPKCKSTFINKGRLRAHQATCGKPLSQCDRCPFKTKYKRQLKCHLLRSHSTTETAETYTDQKLQDVCDGLQRQ